MKALQLQAIEKAIGYLREARVRLEADQSPQNALHGVYLLVYSLLFVQVPSAMHKARKAALERAVSGAPESGPDDGL